jgi:predicted RNase H-like nuclease
VGKGSGIRLEKLRFGVIPKKVGPMMFIGVDGCKKGWFAVKLKDGDEWEARVFQDIGALWAEFDDASVILIDVPIGLKEFGVEERECDVQARKLLVERNWCQATVIRY